MNNRIWYVVVRQPEGEKAYWDFSTMAGSPAVARERGEWEEENTISPEYWKANPAIAIAKLEMRETERLKW